MLGRAVAGCPRRVTRAKVRSMPSDACEASKTMLLPTSRQLRITSSRSALRSKSSKNGTIEAERGDDPAVTLRLTLLQPEEHGGEVRSVLLQISVVVRLPLAAHPRRRRGVVELIHHASLQQPAHQSRRRVPFFRSNDERGFAMAGAEILPRSGPLSILRGEAQPLAAKDQRIAGGVVELKIVFVDATLGREGEHRLDGPGHSGPVVQKTVGSTFEPDIELEVAGGGHHPAQESEERDEVAFPRPIRTDQDVERPRLESVQVAERLESLERELGEQVHPFLGLLSAPILGVSSVMCSRTTLPGGGDSGPPSFANGSSRSEATSAPGTRVDWRSTRAEDGGAPRPVSRHGRTLRGAAPRP